MTRLSTTINALFRALQDDDRGSYTWFQRELAAEGIGVSRATITSWVRDGIPAGRKPEVARVLEKLHRNAHGGALDNVKAVERIHGDFSWL